MIQVKNSHFANIRGFFKTLDKTVLFFLRKKKGKEWEMEAMKGGKSLSLCKQFRRRSFL